MCVCVRVSACLRVCRALPSSLIALLTRASPPPGERRPSPPGVWGQQCLQSLPEAWGNDRNAENFRHHFSALGKESLGPEGGGGAFETT